MVRFLDKDSSGTIDVGEIDKAVREFRELVKDTPSLGTGPMTVIDSAEIDRLARRTFADLVAKHSSSGKDNEIADADADTTNITNTTNTNTTTNNNDDDDGNDNNDNKNDDNNTAIEYTNKEGEGHDVEVLPAAAAATVAAVATAEATTPKADQGLAGGGEAGEGDVDNDDEKRPQQTAVSVSDISAAFAEALRQFKTSGTDGEGQHPNGAMRRPGAQQPSTDTQHAQVRAYHLLCVRRTTPRPALPLLPSPPRNGCARTKCGELKWFGTVVSLQDSLP